MITREKDKVVDMMKHGKMIFFATIILIPVLWVVTKIATEAAPFHQ